MEKSIEIVESYRNWVSSKMFDDGVNVTFTAKQYVDGDRLDEIRLQRNFRYFKNELNSKVFGNAYRRYGKELKMLVIQEESNHQRLHLHTIIERPDRIDEEIFSSLIRNCWEKTRFGYREIDIEYPSDQQRTEGWLGYIMKRRSKHIYGDGLDLMNSSCLYLC